MKIKYDKKIDAKYVYIKKGKITHTKKERDWLLFDYDKNGDVLGVEILDASEHPVNISAVNGDFFGIDLPGLTLASFNKNTSLEISRK